MASAVPALIGTIIFAAIIILALIVNHIFKVQKKNPYASIIAPTVVIAGISMWIMYMGSFLSQLNPIVYPEPNIED